MAMGWVDPWIGLGWVGLGWAESSSVKYDSFPCQTALVNISRKPRVLFDTHHFYI